MLRCTSCQKTYPNNEPTWRCECGSVLDLDLALTFLDRGPAWKSTSSLWQYRRLIPIEGDENIVSLGEGGTPLVSFPERNGIHLKIDYLMPSGSFKDRGASTLVSKIKELGVQKVVEDSSGNAGAAIAGYCAAAGIECDIFVPADSSPAKLAQIALYGANVRKVDGSREDVADAALEAANETYYASHSWNPFFFEGTKTIAFEVYEQLGQRGPDAMILPVGNGTLLLGVSKGFAELAAAGVIEKPPRLIAVQSARCAPLFDAFHKNTSDSAICPTPASPPTKTIAEGISVSKPIRGKQILQAVEESGGNFIAVNEPEIKHSLTELCRMGFYIEPTSAAGTAALNKYARREGEIVVSVLTGSGLKASDKMAGF